MMKMRSRLMLAVGLGVALCQQAYGQAPAIFTGKQSLKVSVTAKYGTVYPARTFNPTLEASMTVPAQDLTRRVVLLEYNQYKDKYKCSLTADIKNNDLVFVQGQKCEQRVITPDFCLLEKARCDARLRNLQCKQEEADGHLGVLTGTVIDGTMSQRPDGAWTMSMKLRGDGCVLVNGRNNNAPIFVRGASLTVERK